MRGKRQQKKTTDEAITLLTHVRELQIRLLVTAVVLVGAGTVAYIYYGQILDILRAPLNAPLYYNSVSGSFAFVMKICMVAGIAVSVPLIIYNFIMFVRPAFLEVFTRKRVFFMTTGSFAAAAAGAVFAFVFVVPGALHFFSGFQVHGLHELISADSYLNFVINVLITFVLAFQLPIIVSLIDRLKPISARALWKGEKWALVGSVVIALIVPFAMDFVTQFLIALPIFVLYNLSFFVVLFQHSYSKKVAKKAVKVEARAARRAEKAAGRPAKRIKGAPVPVFAAATEPLAPHPQLAEVMALQASSKPLNAKSLHQNAQPAKRPVMRLQGQPVPSQVQAQSSASRPAGTPRPVDGFVRGAARTQPANVIRQAGTVRPPQRTMVPNASMRPMNLMSDIR